MQLAMRCPRLWWWKLQLQQAGGDRFSDVEEVELAKRVVAVNGG